MGAITIKPDLAVVKHISSFEQSKRLNELGIGRNTMFYWEFIQGNKDLKLYAYLENVPELEVRYPAFMIQDMLEILGPHVAMWKEDKIFCCSVNKHNYPLPQIKEGNSFFIIKSDSHMAEALAAMCIVLAENGMI